ncbi:DsrE family protein [Rhizobium sp. ICMP 5592]|uniref:DsrE family protein n=1 Tax=Rhizobium sp. ICMP 5592 TaxID=2292445 RepID=UPI001297DFAC|nr:DsrE family protein [Rhizobium sp. ICMP 5592]MQB46146.1 hypothetical protein [Rhizobium sp. ICMP 5592]
MNSGDRLTRRGLLAGIAVVTATGPATGASQKDPLSGVVVLVDSNDPYVMGHTIGYSVNLSKHFAEKQVDMPIEVVANGKGIDLFRADKTTLTEQLIALKQIFPRVTYSVCDSSKKIAEAKERTSISLVPGVGLVPFGIGRVVDLQMAGWAYIHA